MEMKIKENFLIQRVHPQELVLNKAGRDLRPHFYKFKVKNRLSGKENHFYAHRDVRVSESGLVVLDEVAYEDVAKLPLKIFSLGQF